MSIEARVEWSSAVARHMDRLVLPEAALQASGRWAAAGEGLKTGSEVRLDADAWCQPADLPVVVMPRSHFRLHIEPVPGRFYPRLAFADLAQGPRDLQPVRLMDCDAQSLRVDANHPLAPHAPQLVLQRSDAVAGPGHRMADLFLGPGLQAPPPDPERAYFSLDDLTREDEKADKLFYEQPRFVHHLDAVCRSEIARLYARHLQPGMRVLDLMSSWCSHLPDSPGDLFVAGLGMNAEELAANDRLAEQVVKDLNVRDGLPWADAQFDLVVCTASVEYLVQPLAVLREARRVLCPGGLCVVTFSDRWFPTKSVRVWGELHPFERQGLVLSLLRAADFSDLGSESLRGLARPEDDKYAEQRNDADPLFAVWGRA